MSSAEDPSQAGKVRSEALRAQAESALAKAPPTVGPPRSQAGLAHELRVHEIELEMQNAELRKTQIELESSRDHFVELYDFAPVGYFSLSDEGTVTQANLTGAHMLGLERSRLIGRRFSNWVSSTQWRGSVEPISIATGQPSETAAHTSARVSRRTAGRHR